MWTNDILENGFIFHFPTTKKSDMIYTYELSRCNCNVPHFSPAHQNGITNSMGFPQVNLKWIVRSRKQTVATRMIGDASEKKCHIIYYYLITSYCKFHLRMILKSVKWKRIKGMKGIYFTGVNYSGVIYNKVIMVSK